MDNSESGDDIGNAFLSVDSQNYMVSADDLDGKSLILSLVGLGRKQIVFFLLTYSVRSAIILNDSQSPVYLLESTKSNQFIVLEI